MADELIEALAVVNQVKQAQPIRVELPAQTPGHDMAVPQHDRGVDAAFAQQEREASVVAGWLGMWSGALLLKDILKDAVAEPDDERETEMKPRQHECC